MEISANGNDNNFAATTAGSRRRRRRRGSPPTTNDNATTTATIGTGHDRRRNRRLVSPAFDISGRASVERRYRGTVNSYGFLSGAGAVAGNNVNSDVTVNLDGSVSALSIAGMPRTNTFTPRSAAYDNIGGDTGGLVSAAGGTDTSLIDFSTLVDVGSSAVLDVIGASSDAGRLSLSAYNNFAGLRPSHLQDRRRHRGRRGPRRHPDLLADNPSGFDEPAGGVAAGDLAEVHIEAGATLLSVGQIDLAAKKLGQPVPESNLVPETKSSRPHPAQT